MTNGLIFRRPQWVHCQPLHTPLGATDQPTMYPHGSVYMFDKKFKGLDKSEELIRMLRLLDVHPGCAVTIRDSKTHHSSTRLAQWRVQCSQYRTPPPSDLNSDDEEEIGDNNISKRNTKKPSNKHVKTRGTKKKGVVPMFNKTKQDHVASLETTSAKFNDHNQEKKPNQRRTHSKFGHGSCKMTLIIFCNQRDQHYYLSTASTLQHTHHAKLPLKAIPQNGATLTDEEHELLNCLFDCRLKRSEVAKVIETVKGKESTSIDQMTVYNLRKKSLNLINKKSGYSGDLTDPSKTMKKLKE